MMVNAMERKRTLIMKFGGAALHEAASFARIAQLVINRKIDYDQVVIVVSAMGKTTDELLKLAYQIHSNPPRRELDMLISVGERISMSLLAMALKNRGCEAVSFTGSQAGIITTHEHSEALIIDVKPRRVIEALERGDVAIVAGFQGVSEKGEITTLGRGGSDTTAVALGVALNAQKVEFYKDVEGIYDCDPKKDAKANYRTQLTFDEAFEICKATRPVLHPRSISLASRNQIPLLVRSFAPTTPDKMGTEIGVASPRNLLEFQFER